MMVITKYRSYIALMQHRIHKLLILFLGFYIFHIFNSSREIPFGMPRGFNFSSSSHRLLGRNSRKSRMCGSPSRFCNLSEVICRPMRGKGHLIIVGRDRRKIAAPKSFGIMSVVSVNKSSQTSLCCASQQQAGPTAGWRPY